MAMHIISPFLSESNRNTHNRVHAQLHIGQTMSIVQQC